MANRENRKTEKKIKLSPAQKQTAAMAFVVALIVIYVAVELYGAFNVSLKTQTALTSTVYETINADALVVRDEHTVKGNGDAVTVSSVSDCEKVVKGGEIALTFGSQEAASAYSWNHWMTVFLKTSTNTYAPPRRKMSARSARAPRN